MSIQKLLCISLSEEEVLEKCNSKKEREKKKENSEERFVTVEFLPHSIAFYYDRFTSKLFYIGSGTAWKKVEELETIVRRRDVRKKTDQSRWTIWP